MSHFVDIVTAIRNQDALVKALESLGFKGLRVSDRAQNMNDYWGNRSNMKAHVILPREKTGAHADAGFEKTADGTFALRIDDYDKQKFNDPWLAKVTQFHNLEVAKKECDLQGLKYTEEMTEENEPRLRVRIL